MKATEIEAKFYVSDLSELKRRLRAIGAQVGEERHLELNWRYDASDGRLTAAGDVLRVRQDQHTHLTYKRQLALPETRHEIELRVHDLQAARDLLQALGFMLVFIYEKYRQDFTLDPCQVTLDELPFGPFVEIEGPSMASVRKAAQRLGLNWRRRVAPSYMTLFEQLRRRLDLPFRDATFTNFATLRTIEAGDLGLSDAMLSQAGPRSQA